MDAARYIMGHTLSSRVSKNLWENVTLIHSSCFISENYIQKL